MWVAEEGKRWGMRCAHVRTGRCQELEWGEQEQVERVQLEAETVGWAGPDCQGLAGYSLVLHSSLSGVNHLIDHHPVVAQRVAHLGHILPC